MRRRYRIAFVLLLPVLLVTVPLTLAQLYLNTVHFQAELQSELARLLPGRVIEFRMLQVHPDLTVVVHDVAIRHPKTQRKLVGARLATGRLVSRPRDLARGRLRLTDLYAADVTCLLEFDEEGNLSLLEALGVAGDDEESESEIAIELSNVRVSRAQFRMEMPGFELEARDIEIPEFALSSAEDLEMRGRVATPGGWLRIDVESDPQQPDGPVEPSPPIHIAWGAAEVEGFDWRGMQFSASRARVSVPGGDGAPAGLIDVSGSLQVAPELAFTVEGLVRGDGQMPVLTQFTDVLRGPVEVRGRLEGPLLEPRGSFRATSERLEVPELVLHDVAALGTLADGTFSLEEVALGVLGGSASVSGDFAPIPQVYDLKLTLDGIDHSRFLKGSPEALAWAGGRLGGTLSLTGSGLTPESVDVDSRFDLTLKRSGGPTPISVPAELTARGRMGYRPGHVAVTRLDVAAGPHRIGLRGHVEPERSRGDLQVNLATGPVAQLLGALLPAHLDLDGRVAFEGRVSGELHDPSVKGAVVCSGVRALGMFAGQEVRAEVSLLDGVAQVRRLAARTRLGSISLDARATVWSGSVDALLADPPIEVTRAEVRGVPLKALLPAGVELDGAAHADVRLWGTLAAPRGEAQAWTDGIDLYGERVQQARASVALLDGAVELTGLDVSLAGGGRVAAQGRLDWDGGLSGHVVAQRFPVQTVQNLTKTGLEPRGLVTLDLAASGTLEAPSIQGLVQIRELALAGRPLGDAHLSVTSRERTVHVRGEKVFGHLGLDAEVPLDGAWPRVAVRFAELPVQDVVPEVAELGVQATVSGGAELVLDANGAPNASLHLDRVTLAYAGIRATNRAPGRPVMPWAATWDGSRVVLERADLVEGTRRITIKGLYDPERGLDLFAVGQVNLGLLTLATDAVARVEGVAGVDLHAGGPLDTPLLTGRVHLPGPARLWLSALPNREIRLASGELHLEDGRAWIPVKAPFRGRLDDGMFTLTGDVTLARFLPTDARMSLRVRQIEWRMQELGLYVLANADLELLAADLDQPNLDLSLGGRVDLIEGEVKTQLNPIDVLAVIDPRVKYEGPALEPGSELARLRFRELDVVGRDSFFVKSRIQQVGLDLEVATRLTVEGSVGNPLLHGHVEALQGSKVGYSRQELDVTRGTVEFDQDGKPVLDLYAETTLTPRMPAITEQDGLESVEEQEREPEHVALTIRGPIDKLEVRFESNTGLSEDEVVVLIGTGMLREDLQAAVAQGATGGGDEYRDQAIEILLMPLLSGIEQALKDRAAVFDILEIAPNLAASGVQIRIGTKTLEGHLSADAKATVGAERSEAEVSAKLKITDQLWLDVKSDTEDTDSPVKGSIRFRVPLK